MNPFYNNNNTNLTPYKHNANQSKQLLDTGSGWQTNRHTHNSYINYHLYSAYIQSALHCWLTFTQSCTHSHTDGRVNHAGRQPAHQEQSGWGVLLRDTPTHTLGGAGDRTSNLVVTSQEKVRFSIVNQRRPIVVLRNGGSTSWANATFE